MTRPVVLLAEELAPSATDLLEGDFEIRSCDGANRAELLAAIVDVDAVIVRSATQIDAEALAVATKLKVVARAGVGLDNVDVPAATARGVMVVNAPTSNIVSAAEQAIALLFAALRHTAPANQALKGGKWARSKFTGVELFEKTVGVVGLGRIGVLVAQRLAGFGVTLIAYDPYVAPARAASLGIEMVTLDELLTRADIITIHLPKTAETKGLIGVEQLKLVKPTVVIVNAARGGLVDEQALADAVGEGRVYAAGIDVFDKEPTTESPMFAHERITVVPHLGASTNEAQDRAGTAVAQSVRLALTGEFVPDAVNVQAGGPVAQDLRPALPLVEKLGQVLAGLADGVLSRVDIEVHGEIAALDVSVLKLATLRGVFTPTSDTAVSYVNAPLLAAERGVEVELTTSPDSPDYRNLILLRGIKADGSKVSVAGTLTGTRQVQKIVRVNGFDVDLLPTAHLAFFRYEDRSGVVGTVGGILGQAKVNIAGMQVSRKEAGGETLMALVVDSKIDPATLAQVATEIGAFSAHGVDLQL